MSRTMTVVHALFPAEEAREPAFELAYDGRGEDFVRVGAGVWGGVCVWMGVWVGVWVVGHG